MSKYIDLEPKVSEYYGTSPGQERRAGICDALRYIDSHPEHVPGQTMKQSKFRESVARAEAMLKGVTDPLTVCSAFAIESGLAVVPDPEPTNAELIDEAYVVWDRDPQNFTFGEYLDRLGWVKAPGDDDA